VTDQGTLGQSEAPGQSSGVAKAFAAGRSAGLAIAALAAGVISFVSLLGAEKAVLAVVLGILAIRGAAPGSSARRLGILGILLGGLFVVTLVVLLAVLHDQFAKLVRLLHQLS
jgi:hypothetical protein